MVCVFLKGNKIKQCAAEREIVLPSGEELASQCEDDKGWCHCLAYRRRMRENSQPQDRLMVTCDSLGLLGQI